MGVGWIKRGSSGGDIRFYEDGDKILSNTPLGFERCRNNGVLQWTCDSSKSYGFGINVINQTSNLGNNIFTHYGDEDYVDIIADGQDHIYRICGYNGGTPNIFGQCSSPVNVTASGIPPVTCNGVQATIVGTSGNDFINGTSGDDVIVALEGDDIILGNGGKDIICGGDDKDYISGGAGKDTIFGENGKDILVGDGGNDTIEGGAGKDVIIGRGGDDTLKGNGNDDRITGGDGNDIIEGNGGKDILSGEDGDDDLDGKAGFDACIDTVGTNTFTNCEVTN